MPSSSAPRFDVFLSHATPDKPWVRVLVNHLTALGLSVYFDESELKPGDNFVLDLADDGLRNSRFIVVVLTEHTTDRPWVAWEYTTFMALNGPVERLISVILDGAAVPTALVTAQGIKARRIDEEAERVARRIVETVGVAATLKVDDARRLTIGQNLAFLLEAAGESIRITDPLGRPREVPAPWRDDTFRRARFWFDRLSRTAITSDDERAELTRQALTLGEMLFGVLFDEASRELLERAWQPDQPPLVILSSGDDEVLSLPWELLHRDGSFLVRDARLDLVRTVGDGEGLKTPTQAFSLVVNVSAPDESGALNYENESYRLTRALSERCPMTPTELGTMDDLIETVKREQPVGLHFSGHGGPGQLVFEDDEGRPAPVAIVGLVTALRQRLPKGLPCFFYLACCHGNDPSQKSEIRNPKSEIREEGGETVAAFLHREGVAQVVGYSGPIVDVLSTRAEEALYAAIGEGQTTRYAVRQARVALSDREHPFAWAQLVLHHRGPDHPLSVPAQLDPHRLRSRTPARSFEDPEFQRLLRHGFIGRRRELHKIRRRLREGHRLLVLQGLGGLGKSTLSFQVLPWLGEKPDRCILWCQDTVQEDDQVEALVGQLLRYARERFGIDWEGVVQQVDRGAGADPVKRFGAFLGVLLQNVPRLVLCLDNLESLLVGPAEVPHKPDVQARVPAPAFGEWRCAALAALWKLLKQTAESGDKLFVVASCRYTHRDFGRALLPVSPLPNDALFRLLGWFPVLGQLAPATRVRLLGRLAGHPRAVQFTDRLLDESLSVRAELHGEWSFPESADEAYLKREWEELIEPALPQVREQLEADLLLAAIWERVLDDHGRRMLYRMTLLRRAWGADLLPHLGEPELAAPVAEATVLRLRRTSLLEQVDEGKEVRFTLHPATAEFVVKRFGDDAPLRLQSHRRVGEYLESQVSSTSPVAQDIEAGFHLFQAGEYDRAYEILGSSSDFLRDRGRVREGVRILLPFLEESARSRMTSDRVGQLLGTIGLAYAALGQVEKAIGFYEQALVLHREISDRRGEGADLGNLGNAYAALGQVEKAIGFYEQRLVIAREIGDRRGEGIALGNQGLAYAALGQVEKAIGFYEQQLVIAREIGDRWGEGANLGNLGIAYYSLGQAEKAIGFYEQYLVIVREIGDRRGEGAALGNLGLAYADLGQVEKAIGFYEQQLVIVREIGDRRGEANACWNWGNALVKLGRVAEAIPLMEVCVAFERELGHPIAEKHAATIEGLRRRLDSPPAE